MCKWLMAAPDCSMFARMSKGDAGRPVFAVLLRPERQVGVVIEALAVVM